MKSYKGWDRLTLEQIDAAAEAALLLLKQPYERARGTVPCFIIRDTYGAELGRLVFSSPLLGRFSWGDNSPGDMPGDLARIRDAVETMVEDTYLVGRWLEPPLNGMLPSSAYSSFQVGQGGKPGRRSNADDDWAYVELVDKNRPRTEVYSEWRVRIGLRLQELDKPSDSFDHAIANRRKKGK
jgi:hypothetical protein